MKLTTALKYLSGSKPFIPLFNVFGVRAKILISKLAGLLFSRYGFPQVCYTFCQKQPIFRSCKNILYPTQARDSVEVLPLS